MMWRWEELNTICSHTAELTCLWAFAYAVPSVQKEPFLSPLVNSNDSFKAQFKHLLFWKTHLKLPTFYQSLSS
jgi:hypothetical protein